MKNEKIQSFKQITSQLYRQEFFKKFLFFNYLITIFVIFIFVIFILDLIFKKAEASTANFQIEIFYAKEIHQFSTDQLFTETLLNPNNSSLDIRVQEYALSSGEEIEMTMYSMPEDSVTVDKPLPSGKLAADIFYNISFKKTSDNSVVSYFDKPVVLTFYYTDSDIGGIDESSLMVYRWNGSEWVVLSDSVVDTGLNKITATSQNFCYYIILSDNPSLFCGDGSCNNSETCDTCPADCGSCGNVGGGGGGGGGAGAVIQPVTSVSFSGRAYPKSSVILLKDAQIAATTISSTDANFTINLTGLSAGNYIFSLYSEDSKGIRSSLLTFPVGVTFGATTNISEAFIAPTIGVDKSEVKQGENIIIFGQSAPESDIIITVNSDEEHFVKTQADVDGIYLYNFDTSFLEMGNHHTKSKSSINGNISSFSNAVNFIVSTKTISKDEDKKKCGKADLNSDGKVNLIDFSIAAYWYKRQSPPETVDLNNDDKIDLVDFSIMAFYWTG
ncbi:hypothetical protein KAI52_02900 [Candidatus Parcubacteria bacterium]|nr:hypothetical protein [Candidatus Parcubacteria bacterium]